MSVLCLENLFWQRISLKANPEGCLPPVQPAFNLFLSPAKVHSIFLKFSSSRVLPTVVFCRLMQVEPKTSNMLKPKVCEMADTISDTKATRSFCLFCFALPLNFAPSPTSLSSGSNVKVTVILGMGQ